MEKIEKTKIGSVSFLFEVNGIIHISTMDKEHYEVASSLAKLSINQLIKTEKTQGDLRRFLGLEE